MSWEWSHAPEAYEAARKNLAKKLKWELRVMWSEIEVAEKDEDGFYITNSSGLDLKLYGKKLVESRNILKKDLIERIWKFMEEFRTCDNGGFNAYCCPYGCHMVSFS